MGRDYTNVIVKRCEEKEWKEFLDKLRDLIDMDLERVNEGYKPITSTYEQDGELYKGNLDIMELKNYREFIFGVSYLPHESEYTLILQSRRTDVSEYLDVIGYENMLFCYYHDEDGGLVIQVHSNQELEYMLEEYEMETTAEHYLEQNISKFKKLLEK